MAAAILDFEEIARSEQANPLPVGRVRVYAIAFDLDTTQLQQEYPNALWQNAYGDIKETLVPLGFNWQQGSVYFGDKTLMQ
jgi:hypothetical protein